MVPERPRSRSQRRGSTGSLSSASTANTHSCTRRSGSPRTNRSSASIPERELPDRERALAPKAAFAEPLARHRAPWWPRSGARPRSRRAPPSRRRRPRRTARPAVSCAFADQGISSQSSSQSLSKRSNRPALAAASRVRASSSRSSVSSSSMRRPVRVKHAPTPSSITPKRVRAASSSRQMITIAREPIWRAARMSPLPAR